MRRLRFNVTDVSPGYITCSLFQSDNGINWACVGTSVTFPEKWWEENFGEAVVGKRIEFEVGQAMEVRD